jgi:hypothetical protein
MTMKNTTLTALLLSAASVAALPTLAAADYRFTPQLTKLGEVDTHANDAEDYVPVASERFDSIVIIARDGVVPLSGLKVQYTDGKIDEPFSRGFLRPGERLVVDVPKGKPIKMLVLDYNERMSSRWGDRATARVEIYGQANPRFEEREHDWKGRYDRENGRVDQPRPRYEAPRQRVEAPPPRVQNQTPRFEWRGGVYVRVN